MSTTKNPDPVFSRNYIVVLDRETYHSENDGECRDQWIESRTDLYIGNSRTEIGKMIEDYIYDTMVCWYNVDRSMEHMTVDDWMSEIYISIRSFGGTMPREDISKSHFIAKQYLAEENAVLISHHFEVAFNQFKLELDERHARFLASVNAMKLAEDEAKAERRAQYEALRHEFENENDD